MYKLPLRSTAGKTSTRLYQRFDYESMRQCRIQSPKSLFWDVSFYDVQGEYQEKIAKALEEAAEADEVEEDEKPLHESNEWNISVVQDDIPSENNEEKKEVEPGHLYAC